MDEWGLVYLILQKLIFSLGSFVQFSALLPLLHAKELFEFKVFDKLSIEHLQEKYCMSFLYSTNTRP